MGKEHLIWGMKRTLMLKMWAVLAVVGAGVGACGQAPAEQTESMQGALTGRPIMDTHIHLFQVTRPGGVPWPPPTSPLYHDSLPAPYKAMAQPLGITSTGVVEASPLNSDTEWILNQIAGDPFFKWYVAQLDLGSTDFLKNLDHLGTFPQVVGIRGFLWSPTLTLDATQVANLHRLADRGMSLDIISRYSLNPKSLIDKMATLVPNLRIIIDHLAGAKFQDVDPQWASDMQMLAKHPNIYIKFSAFFDMFNPSPTGDESAPWTAPKNVEPYLPHFKFLIDTFGPNRLIWGSNYPVVTLAGTAAEEIAIAEAFLSRYSACVRDKVMRLNAIDFYRRHQPEDQQGDDCQ